MRIIKANLFNTLQSYDLICTTTNGIVKSNGKLVMGAGNAKQFRDFFPGLDLDLGQKVSTYGNQPFLVYKKGNAICSFPTKHHYKDPADLDLIEASAKSLVKIASSRYLTRVALPAPGVGKGGLSWKNQVYPLLKPILDDRFIIHFYKKE